MDLHPKQLLKILNQPRVIHQAAARLPRHQQIEVAVLVGFTAGYGAKHTQAMRAATPGKPKDFLAPLGPQCVQSDSGCQFVVIRHGVRAPSARIPPPPTVTAAQPPADHVLKFHCVSPSTIAPTRGIARKCASHVNKVAPARAHVAAIQTSFVGIGEAGAQFADNN
jgi:hypothetical protein